MYSALPGKINTIFWKSGSYVADYDNVSIASMEKALKQLGFVAVKETAIGATILKKQYEKIISDGMQDVIISSCCHSVNLMIRKYYPEAIQYLARVVSLMQAHCLNIKRRYNDSKTVFIGLCISKKAEAEKCGGALEDIISGKIFKCFIEMPASLVVVLVDRLWI
jgi:iron only hydrogenase large subunit-like protein